VQATPLSQLHRARLFLPNDNRLIMSLFHYEQACVVLAVQAGLRRTLEQVVGRRIQTQNEK
jgi:hypothetical protein